MDGGRVKKFVEKRREETRRDEVEKVETILRERFRRDEM